MTVQVHFYSYFKELTGTAQAVQQLPDGATLGELHRQLMLRFPNCKINLGLYVTRKRDDGSSFKSFSRPAIILS